MSLQGSEIYMIFVRLCTTFKSTIVNIKTLFEKTRICRTQENIIKLKRQEDNLNLKALSYRSQEHKQHETLKLTQQRRMKHSLNTGDYVIKKENIQKRLLMEYLNLNKQTLSINIRSQEQTLDGKYNTPPLLCAPAYFDFRMVKKNITAPRVYNLCGWYGMVLLASQVPVYF